ncbi:MAG: oxidoreductase [bacterium]|nr:oxidoreductase [bacterium]MDE0601495.1 oxidoreductase [bacterium]
MARRPRWTSEQIPDLAGRVAVVTGANSGIGLETVRELARRGARTILACRSEERGRRGIGELQAEMPDSSVELMKLDLGSLSSIQAFAHDFARGHTRLDMLINNAGVMAVPHSLTEDGFESQMGVNHLGHFALTGRLLEPLLATPGARVVTVSSVGHRGATMDFENLLFENGGYTPFRPYWRSKLANLLFTYELERRLRSAGARVSALAAHPGFSSTNIGGHLSRHWYSRIQEPLMSAFIQSAAMGALPTLRAAVDPDAEGGQFYGPSGLGGLRGHPVVVSSNAASHNSEYSRRLWRVSEELTGVHYELGSSGAAG